MKAMKARFVTILTLVMFAMLMLNAYADLTVHEKTTYYTSSMSISGPSTTTVYEADVEWTLYVHYKYKLNGFETTLIETCWKLYDENFNLIGQGCY